MALVDLDEDGALDPAAVGAKAARLARLRRQGLPVAPGLVVTAEEARDPLARAAKALAEGDSGRARLVLMAESVRTELAGILQGEIERRFGSAIVRSSSAWESGGRWAGAFSTFEDVAPDEIATAVRGVWASVFTVQAVELCERSGQDPGDTGMAVLVQPQLQTECGGLATLRPDGTVEVVATSGQLSLLTAGWDGGECATVAPDGRVELDSPEGSVGPDVVAAAAGLVRQAHEVLSDDTVEWAVADGQAMLLQSARSEAGQAPTAEAPPVPESVDPIAQHLSLGAASFPGPLGAELVLPWLGGLSEPVRTDGPAPAVDEPVAALDEARALAHSLTERAWRETGPRAAETARTVLRMLRGQHGGQAVRRLAVLSPVPLDQARRVVSLLDGVASAAVAAGIVGHPGHLWRYSADEARALLAGDTSPSRSARIGPDLWEPFIFSTVSASGVQLSGRTGAEGIGAGPVVVVTDPHAPPALGGREVVVADRPFPSLAPLLWSASALVTFGGSPGAHLMEVAHSLGVPAVLGVDPSRSGLAREDLSEAGRFVAAVDGGQGRAVLHQVARPVAAVPA